MNQNYHLHCLSSHTQHFQTSFGARRSNTYTRKYFKSSSQAVENLYEGRGCSSIQKHINPNFRIPRVCKG